MKTIRQRLLARCDVVQATAMRALMSVATDEELERWRDPELWHALMNRWLLQDASRKGQTGLHYRSRVRKALGLSRPRALPC